MTEQQSAFSSAPEAIVKIKKRFSIVWIVPIVAALIGGALAFKALSEKGPTITITFKAAEGLEAGKTKIKYKHVEVGQVEAIHLSKDLKSVVVTAELVKAAKAYLSENSRFWVVRARVAAGEVTGLGTIFSGAYIGIDPGKPGASARSFKGLEKPPIIIGDLPGRYFLLKAEKLSSLDVGSPVYFRQIKVGRVVAYELHKDGTEVSVKIFIHAPHDQYVRKNTRFWNAGGIDVSIDAKGIKVNTQSFVTLMLGGIAFDTPVDAESVALAQDGDVFRLYSNQHSTYEKTYVKTNYWVLYFKGSVRGLEVGAPVETRGIKVGEVTHIKLEFEQNIMKGRIRVVIEVEPERISIIGTKEMGDKETVAVLLKHGLRAQLKTGSLLTGKLYVDLDFHADAPPQLPEYEGNYPLLPTLPAPMEKFVNKVDQFFNRLEKLPLEQLTDELKATAKTLKEAIGEIRELASNLNTNTAPAVNNAIEQVHKTLEAAESLLKTDSPVRQEMKQALKELSGAARSIQSLADYLERHPESLIKGKGQ